MTALHHYWLHKAPAAPAPTALFAWPCFPSRLYTQGTGTFLNNAPPLSIHGKLATDPWDGGPSTVDPCDLVMFRNTAEFSSQTLTLGQFTRTAEWCAESRVGWRSSNAGAIYVLPLRWASLSAAIRFHPNSGELLLYLGGVVAHSQFLSLASDVLHHFALSSDGAVVRMFVNGVLRHTATFASPVLTNVALGLRYEGTITGDLYVGGVRFWQLDKYTSAFTPPTQLTIP